MDNSEIHKKLNLFLSFAAHLDTTNLLIPLICEIGSHKSNFFVLIARESFKSLEATKLHGNVLRSHLSGTAKVIGHALAALQNEQIFWQRKILELLTDVLLFRTTDIEEHYRMYYLQHRVESVRTVRDELTRLYEAPCDMGDLSVKRDEEEIRNLRKIIGKGQYWYHLQTQSKRNKAREIGEPVDRFVIGSGIDFALRSQVIHVNQFRSDEESVNEISCTHVLGLTVLSLCRLALAAAHLGGVEHQGPFKRLKDFPIGTIISAGMIADISPNIVAGENVRVTIGYEEYLLAIVKAACSTKAGAKRFLVSIQTEAGSEDRWFPAYAVTKVAEPEPGDS